MRARSRCKYCSALACTASLPMRRRQTNATPAQSESRTSWNQPVCQKRNTAGCDEVMVRMKSGGFCQAPPPNGATMVARGQSARSWVRLSQPRSSLGTTRHLASEAISRHAPLANRTRKPSTTPASAESLKASAASTCRPGVICWVRSYSTSCRHSAPAGQPTKSCRRRSELSLPTTATPVPA